MLRYDIDAEERRRDIAGRPTVNRGARAQRSGFRRPQRRVFDDDNYDRPKRNFGFAAPSGPQFETPSGPAVRATVKWYNPDKGFGFVGIASGGDAFLHVSVVERSGNSTVPPGATLEVRTSQDRRGHK